MKNNFLIIALTIISTLLVSNCFAQPYSGTIFIDSTIITSSDPSTIVSTTYTGQGLRTVYDRRIPGWVTINAYLFDIVWNDGLTSEAQINPEFGSQALAFIEADKYATVIGRLPYCLRENVNALWIHKGTQPFGGGNNSILIHTGQSAIYESQGILEETFVHEATHTSLDATHASAPGWIAAQNLDTTSISTYAAANPTTEDVSESFLTWLAVRQCTIRISQQNFNTISQAIPNRLSYFDSQNFNMLPLCVSVLGEVEIEPAINFYIYPNPTNEKFTVSGLQFTENKKYEIRVINVMGKEIYASPITTLNFRLETLNYPDGIYFVQLTSENKSSTHKLIIQH